MSEKQQRKTITLFLDEFIEDYLGENHSRPIRPHIGLLIEQLTKDSLTVKVQWTDYDGRKLDEPILWQYKYWADSLDRWMAAKEKSERERLERHIFTANVHRIVRAMREELPFDKHVAERLATKMLLEKQYNKIKMFGVEKLITCKEEL